MLKLSKKNHELIYRYNNVTFVEGEFDLYLILCDFQHTGIKFLLIKF